MNKDIKRIILTNPVWEIEKVIKICNEQSKDGFQLEKVKVIGKSLFKKDTNKRYVYCVDFNLATMKKGKKREDYLEMFREQGWEFVDKTFNGFSFFRKEYKEELTNEDYEIYTDYESFKEFYSRIEKLLKTLLSIFIPVELLAIICFIICAVIDELSIIETLIVPLVITIGILLPGILFLSYGLMKIRKKKMKI